MAAGGNGRSVNLRVPGVFVAIYGPSVWFDPPKGRGVFWGWGRSRFGLTGLGTLKPNGGPR